jgi:serine/threonine protein kinase
LISLINLIKWFGSLLTYIITLAYSHFRHDHSNSTRDIKANNFLYDPWTHHKISKLGLRSLTSLLFKWVELRLTYIILYFCSDRIRAQYMNTNYNPFIFVGNDQFCFPYQDFELRYALTRSSSILRILGDQ